MSWSHGPSLRHELPRLFGVFVVTKVRISHLLTPNRYIRLVSLRVLILEDRPDDALLGAEHLRRAGLDIAWERVDTEAAFAAKLDSGLDLILADYSLPQFDAPRALDVLKERDLDIPFIVVSGTVGEDAAVAVMRGGARDYVFKGNLSRLRPVIEREVRAAAERRAARVAQDEYLRRLSSGVPKKPSGGWRRPSPRQPTPSSRRISMASSSIGMPAPSGCMATPRRTSSVGNCQSSSRKSGRASCGRHSIA